jgi:hypothetical protein
VMKWWERMRRIDALLPPLLGREPPEDVASSWFCCGSSWWLTADTYLTFSFFIFFKISVMYDPLSLSSSSALAV